MNRVIDRFLAHAVARQEQFSVLAIPQRKGCLPAQMFHAIVAIFLVEMKDAFGVGARPELVPALDKVRIQVREVMRFAVEDDPERFVFVGNGLVAAFDVDDGEPPHAQTDARFHMEAVAIRSAVDDRPGHGFHQSLVQGFRDPNRKFHKCRT